MQKVFHNFLYILLCFSCSGGLRSNAKFNICPEETTITANGTFGWKINSEEDDDNYEYITSQPDLCWYNDSIVVRKCNFENGKWSPSYVQCEKHQNTNIKCPDELSELRINKEYLCFKMSSEPQVFDERSCYGTNLLIGYKRNRLDKQILKFLFNEHKVRSFWMPIKRYEENDFKPFVIRLPGEQWNDLFDVNSEWPSLAAVSNRTLTANKHCIAAFLKEDIDTPNLINLELKIADCNELHYSVCAIEKDLVAKTGCPQNFGALSHRPNECYGITWDGQKYPEDYRMLNVIEYFKKINTIDIIFKELDIVNDKFVEVEAAVKMPDKKWAIKPENNEIKIVSSTEKLHGLCVEYIERQKNVQMLLRFDNNLDSLILTVYNKFYIWSNSEPENTISCFTNAGYEELSRVKLKKIWENDMQTKTIFKLKLKSDYPGQYWCEAHTIFNFTHVSSTKVVAAKAFRGYTYAVQVEIEVQPPTQFILPFNFAPEQMKYMATTIRKEMKNTRKSHKHLRDLAIHNVRIMNILYQNSTHLHCICHITVTVNKDATVHHSNEQKSQEQQEEQEEEEEREINGNQVRREEKEISLKRVKAKQLLVNLMLAFQPRFANTVLSTDFCLPEDDWLLARLGQPAVKATLCLQTNGLPVTRRCLGDFIGGAYWQNKILDVSCINISEKNLLTSQLYSIEKQALVHQQQVENTISHIRELLEDHLENLIPADLYYLASIMNNPIRNMFQTNAKPFANYTIPQVQTFNNLSETSSEILRIVNFLLASNERVIQNSAILNSTNILLDAFEYLMDQISLLETDPENTNSNPIEQTKVKDDESEIEVIEYVDVGVVAKIATNFLVFVIDPQVANVSGMALFRTDSKADQEFDNEGSLRGAFKNENYRFITANQSVDDLRNAKDILMATYVPQTLWQRLDEISMLANNNTLPLERPEPKIIIKVYANDKLFQETNFLPAHKLIKDKIISISIPGHDRDLPEVMPLILTISEETFSNYGHSNVSQLQQSFCGYWNYQTWASDGVMVLNRSAQNNNTVLCGITHLTPFAYLIGGSYNLSIETDIKFVVKEIHRQALDIITVIGCSLSLFGILGLFLTACTFHSWRKRANSKVLLQLSAAIALQMILFCFVNTEDNSNHLVSNQIYNSCIAMGASLHYSVLVQFCWMIIIAYLQFKRYVQVFGNTRPTRFFIKSAALGWGMPLVPVICVIFFDRESYIPQQDKSTNPLCYPSGISFYAGIVFPITLVIIANLVIFIVVIYHLVRNPAGSIRHTEKSLALSQIRVLVLLFFLLGFTWIFGLLNIAKPALIFSYLFCLTATLQGFILFLYFVVMDPLTRHLWCGCFAKICGFKVNKESSSSIKETTQTFQ